MVSCFFAILYDHDEVMTGVLFRPALPYLPSSYLSTAVNAS